MGGYSYKKRNKAVKQSFKNRRSSPRNINIMVGGEEPALVDDEDSEMVGGTLDGNAIIAGFAAIDNYFKTAFIPKDVNKVYIVKQDSTVETLNRSAITPVSINPASVTPSPPATDGVASITPAAGADPISDVNMKANLAISIANVIQKALNVLNAATEASKEEKNNKNTVTEASVKKTKEISSSATKIGLNKLAHSEINNIVDAIRQIFAENAMLAASSNAYKKLNNTLTEFNNALIDLNKL
jgi:hypothetical protein